MDGSIGKAYLKDYTNKTQPILIEVLDNEIEQASKYGIMQKKLLESFKEVSLGGKRIRAALINLAYLACGGTQIEEIIKTSLFIEIFHTSLLIHDDYMDNSPTRREHPTVHVRFRSEAEKMPKKIDANLYGSSMAICLGDVAFFTSWNLLAQSKFPRERIQKAFDVYNEVVHRLVYGQISDITFPGLNNISNKEVLDMLWIKSGIYTSELPLVIGAVLAGRKEDKELEVVKNYAKCLGWAFQIQDDLLGTFGLEEILGKPTTSDITEGKNTLLINYLRNNGSKEQVSFLEKVLGNKNATPEDVNRLKDILIECGAKDHITKLGYKYVEEGRRYAKNITTDKKIGEVLESLLFYMMERTL